jgi:hypothetical protein
MLCCEKPSYCVICKVNNKKKNELDTERAKWAKLTYVGKEKKVYYEVIQEVVRIPFTIKISIIRHWLAVIGETNPMDLTAFLAPY